MLFYFFTISSHFDLYLINVFVRNDLPVKYLFSKNDKFSLKSAGFVVYYLNLNTLFTYGVKEYGSFLTKTSFLLNLYK